MVSSIFHVHPLRNDPLPSYPPKSITWFHLKNGCFQNRRFRLWKPSNFRWTILNIGDGYYEIQMTHRWKNHLFGIRRGFRKTVSPGRFHGSRFTWTKSLRINNVILSDDDWLVHNGIISTNLNWWVDPGFLNHQQYYKGNYWTRRWFQIFLEFFTPKLGEDEPSLTSRFFKRGWNHQLNEVQGVLHHRNETQ